MKKQFVILNLAAIAMFNLIACTKDQVASPPKDSTETEILAQVEANQAALLSVFPNPDKKKAWTIPLNGANEIPAVTTTMVGTAFVNLFKTGSRFVLTHTITLRKIPVGTTIRAAHIHTGISTANGGVVWNLYNSTNPAFASYTPVGDGGAIIAGNRIFLTETQYNDLLNGTNAYYINVHSNTFPTGEIRGQLEPGS